MVQLLRPKTIAIFKTDPTGVAGVVAKVTAFLLTDAIVADVPGRFRFDLVHGYQTSTRHAFARSPVERASVDNAIKQPRSLTVRGSVSATPLSGLGPLLGTFGSIVRRDLAALEGLRALANSGEPLVVVTPAEVHGSMGLANLDEQHGGDDKVELTLSFEEIRIVDPLAITEAVDITAMTFGAASSSNMGAQPVDPFVDPGGLI